MKFLIGIVSIIGFAAYGMAIRSICDSRLFELGQVRGAFVGLLAGVGIWVGLGKRLSFFSVFEHEFTHLIFSLLMFQRPRSFYASDRRGHVSCDRGNFVDGLAPYFFPTFSYLLIAVYPLLKPSAHTYFFPALGFLTGYHIISKMADFKLAQSDIRRCGVFFSIVFCLFAGILSFGFLLAFVAGGFRGGIDFLAAGWGSAGNLMLYAGQLGKRLISYLLNWTGVQ